MLLASAANFFVNETANDEHHAPRHTGKEHLQANDRAQLQPREPRVTDLDADDQHNGNDQQTVDHIDDAPCQAGWTLELCFNGQASDQRDTKRQNKDKSSLRQAESINQAVVPRAKQPLEHEVSDNANQPRT